MTEDEMVGWHHRPMDMSLSKLRELVMDREALACCGSWGRRESATIERLDCTELLSKCLQWSSPPLAPLSQDKPPSCSCLILTASFQNPYVHPRLLTATGESPFQNRGRVMLPLCQNCPSTAHLTEEKPNPNEPKRWSQC